MRRVQLNLTAMLLAACGLLGACHRAGSGSAAPLVKRHAEAASSPADAGPSDLVAAVSGGGADEGPVGLKFQLQQRPVAGQPEVITLRLVANQALEHLEARFRPDDGLEVTQGGDFDPEGQMEAGTSVDHVLTLVPDHEGVYTVMATVTSRAAAEGVSRTFVIPIVVGPAGASMPVAAKPK